MSDSHFKHAPALITAIQVSRTAPTADSRRRAAASHLADVSLTNTAGQLCGLGLIFRLGKIAATPAVMSITDLAALPRHVPLAPALEGALIAHACGIWGEGEALETHGGMVEPLLGAEDTALNWRGLSLEERASAQGLRFYPEEGPTATGDASRLFGAYRVSGVAIPEAFKVYVITEEDRSVTTILLPTDY